MLRAFNPMRFPEKGWFRMSGSGNRRSMMLEVNGK